MKGGHKWAPPRPTIPVPSMVYDARYPQKWGVLRSYGSRAAKVQFGQDFRTTFGWVPFQFLKAVPAAEIEKARKRAEFEVARAAAAAAKEAYDKKVEAHRARKSKSAEDLV